MRLSYTEIQTTRADDKVVNHAETEFYDVEPGDLSPEILVGHAVRAILQQVLSDDAELDLVSAWTEALTRAERMVEEVIGAHLAGDDLTIIRFARLRGERRRRHAEGAEGAEGAETTLTPEGELTARGAVLAAAGQYISRAIGADRLLQISLEGMMAEVHLGASGNFDGVRDTCLRLTALLSSAVDSAVTDLRDPTTFSFALPSWKDRGPASSYVENAVGADTVPPPA